MGRVCVDPSPPLKTPSLNSLPCKPSSPPTRTQNTIRRTLASSISTHVCVVQRTDCRCTLAWPVVCSPQIALLSCSLQPPHCSGGAHAALSTPIAHARLPPRMGNTVQCCVAIICTCVRRSNKLTSSFDIFLRPTRVSPPPFFPLAPLLPRHTPGHNRIGR